MSQVEEVFQSPLGQLLQGVRKTVFAKMPRQVSTRYLARSMPEVLGKLAQEEQYAVVTNRGVPRFLLVPIDQHSWMSLLASSAPEFDHEASLGRKSSRSFTEVSGELGA
jgi:hypothetical protein